MLLAIGFGEHGENAPESRPPIMVLWREVSSAEKWPAVGSEKCGQRPAALSADCLNGCLVSAVHVGTLVAIDLYSDEVVIDELGDRGILVRLAIHHMAPVAPHRTDVEQHKLVLALRFF